MAVAGADGQHGAAHRAAGVPPEHAAAQRRGDAGGLIAVDAQLLRHLHEHYLRAVVILHEQIAYFILIEHNTSLPFSKIYYIIPHPGGECSNYIHENTDRREYISAGLGNGHIRSSTPVLALKSSIKASSSSAWACMAVQ